SLHTGSVSPLSREKEDSGIDAIVDEAHGAVAVEHVHARGMRTAENQRIAVTRRVLAGRLRSDTVNIVIEADVHRFVITIIDAVVVVERVDVSLPDHERVTHAAHDGSHGDLAALKKDAVAGVRARPRIVRRIAQSQTGRACENFVEILTAGVRCVVGPGEQSRLNGNGLSRAPDSQVIGAELRLSGERTARAATRAV